MRKINTIVDKLIKPLSYKFGILETRLRLNWPEIIHQPFSTYSRPTKVIYNKFDKKNTLYVNVSNGSIALEIQYLIPIILEKIAILFGYKVIHYIKIKQEIKFE